MLATGNVQARGGQCQRICSSAIAVPFEIHEIIESFVVDQIGYVQLLADRFYIILRIGRCLS